MESMTYWPGGQRAIAKVSSASCFSVVAPSFSVSWCYVDATRAGFAHDGEKECLNIFSSLGAGKE